MLERILAELALLRADLARGSPAADHAAFADLLRAIVAMLGDRMFCATDLFTRIPAPADAALRGAIIRACGAASPRRLGKRLKLYEGIDVEGLAVIRLGAERDGTVWQVVDAASLHAHTHTPLPGPIEPVSVEP
jgi:hypothetical protein